MSNLSTFCTCKDTNCPLHPTNHDKGCAPCISKNLKQREIPNCFFRMVEETHTAEGYSFEVFAKAVLKESK